MSRNSGRNSDANTLSHISGLTREFLPAPSRIPKEKWQEILENEHIDHIIGSIREEIFRSTADAIQEGYLRNAVYGFVTDCAYEAWMRAFQWVHLEYDNEKISASMSDFWTPKGTPISIVKDPRLSQRKAPTVYGRLEKLILSRKSSNCCKASYAKATFHDENKRLNMKIRINPQL